MPEQRKKTKKEIKVPKRDLKLQKDPKGGGLGPRIPGQTASRSLGRGY
jgi:hypothetical protein